MQRNGSMDSILWIRPRYGVVWYGMIWWYRTLWYKIHVSQFDTDSGQSNNEMPPHYAGLGQISRLHHIQVILCCTSLFILDGWLHLTKSSKGIQTKQENHPLSAPPETSNKMKKALSMFRSATHKLALEYHCRVPLLCNMQHASRKQWCDDDCRATTTNEILCTFCTSLGCSLSLGNAIQEPKEAASTRPTCLVRATD